MFASSRSACLGASHTPETGRPAQNGTASERWCRPEPVTIQHSVELSFQGQNNYQASVDLVFGNGHETGDKSIKSCSGLYVNCVASGKSVQHNYLRVTFFFNCD